MSRSSSVKPNLQEKLPGLIGVRAIAAWMIYFHHFQRPFPKVIADELNLGMPIFFVLSGFLITYRYYDSGVKLRDYFRNRAAKI
jgi:peptidoglycan/LPS O-acetylase OafA/YrhL